MATVSEEQVVVLRGVSDLIDSMVNYEMLDFYWNGSEAETKFKTSIHQKHFGVLLLDLLSANNKVCGANGTYLQALRAISDNPQLGNREASELQKAVRDFSEWLDQEVAFEKVWFPAIDRKMTLTISRAQFLKICGNISKHNITRLSNTAERMRSIFSKNGVDLGVDEEFLVLGDFYEKFHGDILNYHGSTIAELLNSIRWGIYQYLSSEYARSVVWLQGDPQRYEFRYPAEITGSFARACYLELMNSQRRQPYVPRFRVTRFLRIRY